MQWPIKDFHCHSQVKFAQLFSEDFLVCCKKNNAWSPLVFRISGQKQWHTISMWQQEQWFESNWWSGCRSVHSDVGMEATQRAIACLVCGVQWSGIIRPYNRSWKHQLSVRFGWNDHGLLLLADLTWDKNTVLTYNPRSFMTKRTGTWFMQWSHTVRHQVVLLKH